MSYISWNAPRRVFVRALAAAIVAAASFICIPTVRAAVDRTYDQLRLLVDVMALVKENYVEPRENQVLLNGAIHGMVRTLDPFSQFLEPRAYQEMKTETEGEFGGVGIRISMKNDVLTVMTPIPGTPAYRAGILPDDRIIQVDSTSLVGLGMSEAVELLRGKPGTPVKVQVLREGVTDPIEFNLKREKIKIETVRNRLLESGIGYIQLSEFNANSERDLAQALGELDKQGMQSLVLDLRNNPGGLLDSAVGICREFVGEGQLVVYTQGRAPDSRRNYYTAGSAPYQALPMAILVNKGSASASEIVSGALQDLKRALIVGATTYGKGSVQSIFPLSDGNALRLTTAKYYTPSGRIIHRDEKSGKGGIVPDIVISVSREIEAKLYAQNEQIFARGMDPKPAVKKQDMVSDEVLDRAVQMLRAGKVPVVKPPQKKL